MQFISYSKYKSIDTKAVSHLNVFDAEAIVDLDSASNLYRIIQNKVKSS